MRVTGIPRRIGSLTSERVVGAVRTGSPVHSLVSCSRPWESSHPLPVSVSMLHRRLIALSLATVVLAPSTAFSASATQDAYSSDGGPVITDETDPASDAAPAEAASAAPAGAITSSLPFTGVEAGLIGIAGLGLMGTGVALRRSTRQY